MPLTARDVCTSHASIAAVEDLVAERRALYSAAVELAHGRDAAALTDPSVLDNPATRAALGLVLGGAVQDPVPLGSIELLADERSTFSFAGQRLWLASSPAAPVALATAIERVRSELGRHGDEGSVVLLTDTDAGFREARRIVAAGLELLTELLPELAADLAPHIAMIGLVSTEDGERLGSASAREIPGLILIPRPTTPLEVAEAVVHEGAHQKFFDLEMTRDVLAPTSAQAAPYLPHWAPKDAPVWALEQCFAAFHAYSLLAVLQRASEGRGGLDGHAASLLPYAARRASEIGTWLRHQAVHLGSDGSALLALLSGEEVEVAPSGLEPMPLRVLDESGLIIRRCGERTLLIRPRRVPEIFWASAPR